MFRKGRFPLSFHYEQPEKQRDAFFWYLLISNIVLVGLIVSLVIKALLKVYF
jgi:hypothetical protein